VPTGRWLPPIEERQLGLEFYATDTPPVPARIKSDASDFEVREISEYPMPDPEGPYTVLRVRSRDWEQHELAQRLAERLHLPPHAIAWAGTKDRRAVSERLFSYRGLPPDRPVDVADAEVLEAYRARDGLALGHHYGNAFGVRLSDIVDEPAAVLERLGEVRRELIALGGFPNLFGLQRFGEVRPVTHLVGRALVRGRPAEAAEIYLTEVTGDTDTLGAEARREYARHRDPVRALREFPPTFRFEKRLLDHLARGHSPERAIGALSRDLRTLFIHAYQSLLFNRWASRRASAGLSTTVPEAGDWLLRVGRNGTISSSDPVSVEADNLAECREFCERSRAVIAGPLVGYETPRMQGVGGELLESLLEEEGVSRDDWRIRCSPDLASRGAWRALSVPTPPIALSADPPGAEDATAARGVWLRFSLPKGSYATVLLREFVKSGATAEAATPAL
jgi:tRNA pseudouridine13 synthase